MIALAKGWRSLRGSPLLAAYWPLARRRLNSILGQSSTYSSTVVLSTLHTHIPQHLELGCAFKDAIAPPPARATRLFMLRAEGASACWPDASLAHPAQGPPKHTCHDALPAAPIEAIAPTSLISMKGRYSEIGDCSQRYEPALPVLHLFGSLHSPSSMGLLGNAPMCRTALLL